jgi:hypothetical protein
LAEDGFIGAEGHVELWNSTHDLVEGVTAAEECLTRPRWLRIAFRSEHGSRGSRQRASDSDPDSFAFVHVGRERTGLQPGTIPSVNSDEYARPVCQRRTSSRAQSVG